MHRTTYDIRLSVKAYDIENINSINKTLSKKLLNKSEDRNFENGLMNWQLEIRKLTYGDSGTYVCSLPLEKPITKKFKLKIKRIFQIALIN